MSFFNSQPEPIVTVSEAVERFIAEHSPLEGPIVEIKRAFSEFSTREYNKRSKHWLRCCHSLIEKVIREDGRG